MMALHGTLVCHSMKIAAITKLGLFFPVVCFIHVFDQTLAEQLYPDKGLERFIFQIASPTLFLET